MSFLIQTNEDYIKIQMRSLLTNPLHKKQLKRKLRKIGLYTPRLGFGTYKYFIDAELNRNRSKSINARYYIPSVTSNKKQGKIHLPQVTPTLKKISGIMNCNFLKRGKTSIACCILYKLTWKINLISAPIKDCAIVNTQNQQNSEIKSEFTNFYLSFFLGVAKHNGPLAIENDINLPIEIIKQISSGYQEIQKMALPGKKTKHIINDTRLLSYLETKPWAVLISESLNRFFFKKYSILGEKNFQNFITSYLLTNNLLNIQKICFDLYDRNNAQFITPSDLFFFFENPIFPLIQNDLFAMINYLSNYKYTNEKHKLKRKPTKYLQELEEKQNKKISFKVFSKLAFDQKFPDMILALIYLFLGDAAVNFYCMYYDLNIYKVHNNGCTL